MAKSPSHRLGELIGDFFEESIIEYLKPLVDKKGFYLDYRHPRKARNDAKEVVGIDEEGNKHKLDIVIEEGGSEDEMGKPKAFIEMAWRRYTKHSKAKAQEISGAILPLVRTYRENCPFYAAVLSGEFTQNSIAQLESQGFYVVHISYEDMCQLYREAVGIEIAWEEGTPDAQIEEIATNVKRLSSVKKQDLKDNFYRRNKNKLEALANRIKESLDQQVTQILVIPIHGKEQILLSVDDAVEFIKNYDEDSKASILRYEVTIKYNSGDEFTMKCGNKLKAI
ncbi:MAG: hypothetical protein NC293_10690 [Roseburia sp.]|nr:hypothetical protein [Roseburia sp.]